MAPSPAIALFYRYFLPTPAPVPPEGSDGSPPDAAAVDEPTLSLLRQHASHYLPKLQGHQRTLCQRLGGATGRILLSREGINGTLAFPSGELLQEYVKEMEGFDLLHDLGLPPKSDGDAEGAPEAGRGRLFAGIDWKVSTGSEGGRDPFPDLKIQTVKEIVNTGGTIDVNDIPKDSGKEISPEEFHQILMEARQNDGVVVESNGKGHDAGADGATSAANRGCSDLPSDEPPKKKEVVLIDVRNTFEHAVGHFLHPHSNALAPNDSSGDAKGARNESNNTDNNASDMIASPTPALNPNTVTFSHFDQTFCSKFSDALKDKKVLMYCTGGIRCVKASAMLKQRGVEDVSHLSGGIHRYVEQYGSKGFWKGKLMVFDQRVALDPDAMASTQENDKSTKKDEVKDVRADENVVGHCIECQTPYDQISGATLCTVCRDLILLCPDCKSSLNEFHCERHCGWKNSYFTFLERFTIDELQGQHEGLKKLHDDIYVPAKEHKNVRRTLRKQMDKVLSRIKDLEEGTAEVNENAKRRCRTCFESEDVCDGLCWGFWRSLQSPYDAEGDAKLEPISLIKVGDRVTPGPHWNTLRYGSRCNPTTESRSRKRSRISNEAGTSQSSSSKDGPKARVGTVVEVKSWASGGNEMDCVAVSWDADSYAAARLRDEEDGTKATQETGIYRWGVVARNGKRMYDVKLVS